MLLNSVLLTLPLLVVAPLLHRRRPALPQAGAEGLHHRGRHVLGDQLDPDRDGRGRAYGRGARAAGPAGSSQFDVDIDVSAQAERYTMTLRNILFLLLGLRLRHCRRCWC